MKAEIYLGLQPAYPMVSGHGANPFTPPNDAAFSAANLGSNHVGNRVWGGVEITTAGEYIFRMASDDGPTPPSSKDVISAPHPKHFRPIW